MTWTLILYMAGDAGAYFPAALGDETVTADLSASLRGDLAQLRQAGSSPAVSVCVQFDSLRHAQAFRWIVPPPGESGDPVPIGATNTGEPAGLADFMGWAARARPADHYALIVWGHGSGWSEADIYAAYRGAAAATRDASPAKTAMLRRGIFASTAAQLLAIENPTTRGLCYDDSARDFLDNAELRRALVDGAAQMGRPRVDVLGLDACLMTMIEVAVELSGAADYLAGAETVLPQASWPWRALLAALAAAPDLPPRAVARLMAGGLPQAAPGRGLLDVCQSALDLSRADAARSAAGEWVAAARSLLTRDPALGRALAAGADALRLSIPRVGETDYVDLLDWLRRVWREWDLTEVEALLDAPADAQGGPRGAFRRATRGLLAAIQPEGAESLVYARAVAGFSGRAPGGLSIYLPPRGKPWSPMYARLRFAETGWGEFNADDADGER